MTDPTDSDTEDLAGPLRGRVSFVAYASPRFTAGKFTLDPSEESDPRAFSFSVESLVGLEDTLIVEGRWEEHSKYGRQLKVTKFSTNQALTGSGLARYLATHPEIRGIGPAKAEQIAKFAGDDFEHILLKTDRLVDELGITPLAVQNLRKVWAKNKEKNATGTWLASHGLTHHQVTSLLEEYGDGARRILETNPYGIIGSIRGFGFRVVDEIARKVGVAQDSIERTAAAAIHLVTEAYYEGHCYTSNEALVHEICALLEDEEADAWGGIDQAIGDERLASTRLDDGTWVVALPKIERMEREVYEEIRRRTRSRRGGGPAVGDAEASTPRKESDCPRVDWGSMPEASAPSAGEPARLERSGSDLEFDPRLNDKQRLAVESALKYKLSVVTGGAGSGKTFTVQEILRLAEEHGETVVLASPTGRAAKRLEEVVGSHASTLHRLLKHDGRCFGHERPACSAVDADLLIVDEASMVDVELAYHLFQSLMPDTRVVLVGDHEQLPSVGAGNVLRDLIENDMCPVARLTEVMRQSGVLKENACAVLAGEVRPTVETVPIPSEASAPPAGEPARLGRSGPLPVRFSPWIVKPFTEANDIVGFVHRMYDSLLETLLGLDPMRDVQLLVPMKKGPVGADLLNRLIQMTVQKRRGVETPGWKEDRKPTYYAGDRVIQMRNDYDTGIMNGTIGEVAWVDEKANMEVQFDGEDEPTSVPRSARSDVSLAYALTVHKAQGAEFPCTVVVVYRGHAHMLDRNLLYTAVTRSRETTILVGDVVAMRGAARRNRVQERRTFLSAYGRIG